MLYLRSVRNNSECIKFEEHIDGLVLLFTQCLGLRPFWFNVIKVWRIRRQGQVFKRMPGIGNGGFDILSFMERRVDHDNPQAGRSLGKRSCVTHAWKMSALILAVNKPTVRNAFPSRAPMTLARPLACQSFTP